MALEDDIVQAQEESEAAADERVIFPGTINSVSPLTVSLDGSGVAVPCLNMSGVTLGVGRRVGVITLGSDLVVIGSFGPDVIVDDLTVQSLTWGSPASRGVSVGQTNDILIGSTTYITTGLGVAFVAPPSGKVLVNFQGRIYITQVTGSGSVSPMVKTGALVDAGAIYAGPTDVYCIELGGQTEIGDYITAGASRLIPGLTPGASYNVTMYHKANPVVNCAGSTKVTVSVIPVL